MWKSGERGVERIGEGCRVLEIGDENGKCARRSGQYRRVERDREK